MAHSLAEAFRPAFVPPTSDEPPSQVRRRLGSALSPIERASGHDIHFLQRLDRVEDHQVELALTLYRDEELLAEVLRRAALPPSFERLAISLDDDREGPFVIVTRTGRFVTCLGRGMRIDPKVTPLLTRARLDAAASTVERMRERLAAARELQRSGGEGEIARVMKRLAEDWRRFCREDAELLLRFRPVIGEATFQAYAQCAGELSYLVPLATSMRFDRPRPREEELLYLFDRASFGAAHLLPLIEPARLAELDPTSLWPSVRAAMHGGTYAHLARALWVAAHHGARMFAEVSACVPVSIVGAEVRELALAAMRFDTSRLRSDAERAQARREGAPPEERARFHEVAVAMAELVSTAVASPLAMDALGVAHGRARLASLGLGRASDATARAVLLSDPSPAMDSEVSLVMLPSLLAGVARASVAELYLPREVARLLPRATPAVAVATVECSLRRAGLVRGKPSPVRATARLGRNDACACGSGKKYKKCCGRVH